MHSPNQFRSLSNRKRILASPAILSLPASPTPRRMASALSIALGAITATGSAPAGASLHAPQIWPVQTCVDTTAPGSLRYIASHALSGDTIDFGQLPMLCGMADSTITLAAGEIVLHQQDITLKGPAQGSGTLTISGGDKSRVIRHQVYSPFTGTLTIDDLRIEAGYALGLAAVVGGCIYSDANVTLNRTTVRSCKTYSQNGHAHGGGIQAVNGTVSLASSLISGNVVRAASPSSNAHGGGISAPHIVAKYSEIEGNVAQGVGPYAMNGLGGGLWVGSLSMSYSTVANNTADLWGGGVFVSASADQTIVNSAFSGNHSYDRGGAVFASTDNLLILNSTIASNSTEAGYAGGIYFRGTSVGIQSSIIASNTAAGIQSGADFYLKSGTLTGADNAIMSSNVNPAGFITLTQDPKLGPLAWIGGATRAMDLPGTSPAIGLGNNSANRAFDQRGQGFPRTTGPAGDVDIGAVQATDRVFFSDLDRFLL